MPQMPYHEDVVFYKTGKSHQQNQPAHSEAALEGQQCVEIEGILLPFGFPSDFGMGILGRQRQASWLADLMM